MSCTLFDCRVCVVLLHCNALLHSQVLLLLSTPHMYVPLLTTTAMNSTQYSFVSSSINSLKLVCFHSAMAHGCIKSSHMCHLTEGDDVVHRVSKVDKFCDGEALASLIRFGRCFKKCQSFYNLFYVAHVCLSCCKLECVSLQRQEQDVVILHVLLVCYKHCHIRCCICVMRFYWDLLRVVNIYCFPIYFLPIWCSRNVAKKNLYFLYKTKK
jgi:hypothetical protein